MFALRCSQSERRGSDGIAAGAGGGGGRCAGQRQRWSRAAPRSCEQPESRGSGCGGADPGGGRGRCASQGSQRHAGYVLRRPGRQQRSGSGGVVESGGSGGRLECQGQRWGFLAPRGSIQKHERERSGGNDFHAAGGWSRFDGKGRCRSFPASLRSPQSTRECSRGSCAGAGGRGSSFVGSGCNWSVSAPLLSFEWQCRRSNSNCASFISCMG